LPDIEPAIQARHWRVESVANSEANLIKLIPSLRAFSRGWATELSDMARALSWLPVTHRESLLLVGAGGFSCEDPSVV
jgi:hypothetical protein